MPGGRRTGVTVDADADHVLTVPMTSTSPARIFHLPSDAVADAPACGVQRNDGKGWSMRDPATLPDNWRVCKFCTKEAAQPDMEKGQELHKRLSDMTPEDLAFAVQAGKPPSSTSVHETRSVSLANQKPSVSDDAEGASREEIRPPSSSESVKSAGLLPLRPYRVVRHSPLFRRCSNATTSVHRLVWSSVPFGRSGSLRTACKGKSPAESGTAVLRVQVPTQKQEAPTSTSEGRVGPSAVGRGSSRLGPWPPESDTRATKDGERA